MPKPELGPITVGDQLIVLPRGNHETREATAVATKVGRVWIELSPADNPNPDRPKWRMRLDDQTDGSRIGYPTQFVTPEQHAWMRRIAAARRALKDADLTLDWNSSWRQDEDRLFALAAFVTAYEAAPACTCRAETVHQAGCEGGQ